MCDAGLKRAVKYCGGCNPRFDRTAFVRKLEDRLGERLLSPSEGRHFDIVYT